MMKSHRVLVSCVAVVAVLAACVDEPTVGSGEANALVRPLEASQLNEAKEKAAVAGSLPRMRWVAYAHADAMQELMANGIALRSASAAGRCSGVGQIVRNQFGVFRRESGLSDAQLETILTASLRAQGCRTTAAGSIFGTTPFSITAVARTDTVTGAYEYYTPAMEAAITGSHPSVVESQVASVLASATSLPPGDYEVLSAIASMVVSDVYYWYGVQVGGGCGACGGDDPINEMSIFGRRAPMSLALSASGCGFWCRTGWSDLVGGLGAAAAVVYGSGGVAAAAPAAVGAAFGIGAVTASALYAIAEM
jgi:hypothetical protein